MAGYHVSSFGCRASQADGDAISAELSAAGMAESPVSEADCVVLNTCSVTAQAEKTARAYLRRVRRTNPTARVIVTGCYAQRAPREVAALEGSPAVLGNSHKGLVSRAALALMGQQSAVPAQLLPISALLGPGFTLADDGFAHADLTTLHLSGRPTARATRPNLKVQDGCGNRCSFCIIPTTRGGSRSLALEDAVAAVQRFAEAGGSELVLSGINLGRWGRDLRPAARLEDLVEALLSRTLLPRLRLSSIEPMDWTADLLALLRQFGQHLSPAGPRLARHAHLPLQSGADAMLRAMHRRYRPWHYEEKLAAIREALPQAAIGADVMVGFPGETDVLFEESFQFICRQPLTYLHLFPFSPRPGTPGYQLASRLPVAPQRVQERMDRLRRWAAQGEQSFAQQQVGQTLSVITLKPSELERERGETPAISDNFQRVQLRGHLPANLLRDALITSCSGGVLHGEADFRRML